MKVLVSPGFGAGWSTWNDNSYELATDPELIRHFEAKDRAAFEARAHVIVGAARGGDGDSLYFGGYGQLEVVEGEGRFRIDEYDGDEKITWEHNGEWWSTLTRSRKLG